jgi:hypothetical protein
MRQFWKTIILSVKPIAIRIIVLEQKHVQLPQKTVFLHERRLHHNGL